LAFKYRMNRNDKPGIAALNIRKCFLFLLLFCCFIPSIISFIEKDAAVTPEELCRKIVLEHIDRCIFHLKASEQVALTSKAGNKKIKALKEQYRNARAYYKPVEFFIEYYSPFEAKFFINGPLVPKIEMEISSEVFQPHGFQVMEEFIFSGDSIDTNAFKIETELLISKLSFLRDHYSTMSIERGKIEEALKLQLVRIMCLTLNGYDCTINKETIAETGFAIKGAEDVLKLYAFSTKADPLIVEAHKKVMKSLQKCRAQLGKHPGSDTFDRLAFMTGFLNPAYMDLLKYCEVSGTKASPINYAVNFKAGSFFEANSINKQYFSVYITDKSDLGLQSELGKLLFYDPVLSGNNKRACASCHQADKGFADGLDKSTAFDGIGKVTRNAPTLINAAYQKLFFHDGRLFNLEEQANAVFKNTFEMSSDKNEIVNKLKGSDEYRALFREAFKNRPDTVITPYAVLKAITEFIKTLDSRNSRFDRYLKGDRTQLTADEKNGYNLFSGKALCGSCHFFPLFNGTVPPMFNDNEFEVIGVAGDLNNKTIDPDLGRQSVTHSQIHAHAFKTPTVRNIALTAPYMHNGLYKELDSVLVFYNRGGGAGSGLNVENQTLPFDSLSLSIKELKDLKGFLLALTDTSGLPRPPKKLPEFKNEALNNRKIGGEY